MSTAGQIYWWNSSNFNWSHLNPDDLPNYYNDMEEIVINEEENLEIDNILKFAENINEDSM
jgi:hypothetical protein